MSMIYDDEKQKLVDAGFSGFVTIGSLMADIAVVPAMPGVYVVMRKSGEQPMFLQHGTGGFFKGKEPNVGIPVLGRNWVGGTSVVYIGKAGGSKSGATLRSRLEPYMQFGQGKPVGHYGGRYIWQLQDAQDLVVCWKTITDEEPRDVERRMIEKFKNSHNGYRPFANLKD